MLFAGQMQPQDAKLAREATRQKDELRINLEASKRARDSREDTARMKAVLSFYNRQGLQSLFALYSFF